MDAKLIALLPFTLLIAISTFLLWRLLPGTKPFDYGLTIDAGSSHSEVILYKWSEKINGTGHAEQMANEDISTGIDDHGEDIKSAVDELHSAVASIVEQIPTEVPGPFPLFLGATAGIRILNLTKPKLVDQIMNSINGNLSGSVFNDGRTLKVKQVRILTGTEEGLYAWVTANYLLNYRPNSEHQSSPAEEKRLEDARKSSSNFTTIGILDMGGASSQIAYQSSEGVKGNGDQSVAKVTLFGQTYTIKSHSNLCFGSDQAYIRYLFELVRRYVQDQDNVFMPDSTANLSVPISIKVPDPCNYDSPDEVHQGREFILNPCLKTYRPIVDANLTNMEITFTPALNHSKCADTVIKLIDSGECDLSYRVCPTHDEDRVNRETHFYALSSYYFSTKVLPTLRNGGEVFANDSDYLQQVAHWCSTPWVEKVQLSDPKYTRYLCFKQIYIYYTLKTIYQFDADSWPYIHFRNKISESSLSWSLGYMLAETNVIPAKPVKPPVWTKYTFYGSIGLVIGVCLFLVTYWVGKRSKSAVINHKA